MEKHLAWLGSLLLCCHTAFAWDLLRWCTISEQELAKCSDMSKAFSRANLLPDMACVKGSSAFGCIAMINASVADVAVMDGGFVYQAGKEYNLKPVVGEAYGQDVGTSYYAVAVVSANSNLTLNNLKGAKSCHTGLNRTAGWNVPIGLLLDSGRMPAMGCNIAEAVGEFFKASCVPGARGAGYPPSLCELCKGNATGQGRCEPSPQEEYYDYLGALRCLVEGAGDVAFIKHSTVLEAMTGPYTPWWGRGVRWHDFQLLCRDGSKAAITAWQTCYLARVPAHAMVTRADMDGVSIFQLLNQGQQRFGGDDDVFQMFDSIAYGGKNLLFKDTTTELVPIMEQTYLAWLGDEYLHAMRGLDCDPTRLPEFLRWCVLSREEIHKCSKMAGVFKSKNLTPEIQCVSAKNQKQCMEQIQKGHIDVVTLAGEDVYTAGKAFGLVPAAGEGYADGDNTSTYYAVAVVERSPSDAFTIDSLRGRRSCHTGYGRRAGWTLPVGLLLRKGFIQPQGCSILKAVSDFFSASCIPTDQMEDYPANLCTLCAGDGHGGHRCQANSQERYYGYAGAFRCLVESHGDVAFVKHTSVFENTDGQNTEPWASKLRSEDFQLLCPNGARAEVGQFAKCHWGQVPSRAIMVRPDTNTMAVYGLLDKAQDYFGNKDNSEFRMFNSTDFQGEDLIFKDSTIAIVPVGERTTYTSWLGPTFLESMEGWISSQCSGAVGKSMDIFLLLMTSLGIAQFNSS